MSFVATTNWTYRLQRTDSPGGDAAADWADVLTLPPQASLTNVAFTDEFINASGCYRLMLTP